MCSFKSLTTCCTNCSFSPTVIILLLIQMTVSLKREKEKKNGVGWGWNVFTLSYDTKAALSVVWESTMTMMLQMHSFFSRQRLLFHLV